VEIPGGRKGGQWIVGIGIGLHFTPIVIEQVISHFGLIFFGALVTSVSSVVGVWLQRLKQPNPWLFGPLLLSATVSITWDLHIGLPQGGSQIGQWLIGSGLGCHFNRSFFRRAPSFIGRTLLGTALTMVIAALAALGLSAMTHLDLRSLTLGMMPGGIAEMSLTAEVLQLSVPLVTAMQVMRLLFVLFLAEPLFRHWDKRAE
jgi:membrane AbrB-like protein